MNTMAIKALDLVEKVRQAHAEKWGYIWGTRGQVWTQAKQDAATRDMTVRYGAKWVGRKVADCSGLIKWAFRELGGDIYHGSDTMWRKYTSMTGRVEGTLSIRPGTAVFMEKGGKRTHVGIYIGGGKCIEAQGTRTGVVMSDLHRWDEWGMLTDVDYTGVAADEIRVALPTIRKGDDGAHVRTAQELLIAAGYDIGLKGADGIFGSDTLSAVRAYQADHGLKPDGIIGPDTWGKLQQTDDDEPVEDKPIEDSEDPSDAPLTVEERLTRLEEAVFGQEGGESDA
jgi:hypothetical protein